MRDSLFRRTEGVLFKYARTKNIIARTEVEIDELERQIAMLKLQLSACHAEPGSAVANYSGVLGGSGSSTSTAVERAVISAETRFARLSDRLSRCQFKLDLKLFRLCDLREETVPIDYVYQTLEEIDQHIFVQRYFYSRTNSAIGAQLNYTEGTIRLRRRRMILRIAQALEIERYEKTTICV